MEAPPAPPKPSSKSKSRSRPNFDRAKSAGVKDRRSSGRHKRAHSHHVRHNSGDIHKQLIDNCNYLHALNEPQVLTDILKGLPEYSDAKVQRIEEYLRSKGAINFDRIFYEPTGYYLFTLFLDEHPEYSVDKALFIKDVDNYTQMRLQKARLKVAKLLFARYMAQTPTHEPEQEEKMENGHVEEKTSKKKKGKKKVGISIKTKNDEYRRPSVFDAIKQRNKNRRLLELQKVTRTPRARASTRSVDLETIGENKTGDGGMKRHRRAKSARVEVKDGGKRGKYSPRFSLSMTDYDPDAEIFEVGVQNDINLYGPSVQEVADKLTKGEAPSNLFIRVAREIRDALVRQAFPDFKASRHYKMYIRTKLFEDKPVYLHHFEKLRVLGRGGFGTVYACRKADSGKLYAMKEINKRLIKHKKAVAMTMLERHTLSLVHSRFVCGLSYAFQDEDHLYLIMDLMAGGDLKFHLTKSKSRQKVSPRRFMSMDQSQAITSQNRQSVSDSQSARSRAITLQEVRGFPEDRARFHAAQVLLGLEAMHMKNIIFRDLKLENVLLDDEGNCRITDLGLVALYGKKKVSHYAGTPGYIAPEVAMKKPYTPAVDIFSFGVTLYRMLSGKKPFKGHSRRDFDRAVCEDEPEFDELVFSPDAVDLIKGLLTKDPRKRLGCGSGKRNGIQAIKDHPFFAPIDWGLLEVGYLDPVFVPNKKDINASNVHHIYREEDKKQWKTLELDDKFERQIKGFEYVSPTSVREEIVAALKKQRQVDAEKEVRRIEAKANTGCCVII